MSIEGQKVERKSTETENLINGLDSTINSLITEVNRTRRIKARYMGVEPEAESGESKSIEPNGLIDTMHRKVNTINILINELSSINNQLENFI